MRVRTLVLLALLLAMVAGYVALEWWIRQRKKPVAAA